MGKVRTSAAFYRRGVSNQNKNFGTAAQGNYPIIQPMGLYIASQNKNKKIVFTK